ncbi:MAG: radical SAM protein [Verrucomicrobia bacterium]|nr:radical SAM protein [Verrucomicrobiota bacterium]
MFPLPWTRTTVPHGVIELTRECNLACRACYRAKAAGFKPVADILEEVAVLERNQRLHTVSLAGGEPTLHPHLPEIVRSIKQRGLRVSLVTNGLLLDDPLLEKLRAAKLDVVMVHVDEGQRRPDLSNASDPAAVNRLREILTERVHSHGIAAGLCTTIYPESLRNLPSLVELFLRHPHINFLFATHAVSIASLIEPGADRTEAATRNGMVIPLLRQSFGLEPFAYLPAAIPTGDGEHPCITYTVPVAHAATPAHLAMRPTRIDRSLIRLAGLVAGRFPYFTPHSTAAALAQILCNAIGSGRPLSTLAFLVRAVGRPLRIKRMVFENTPRLTASGSVNCCDACPNSTVRDGKVVPVCLADHARQLTP